MIIENYIKKIKYLTLNIEIYLNLQKVHYRQLIQVSYESSLYFPKINH